MARKRGIELVLVCFLCVFCGAEALKVLVVYGFPIRSLSILGHGIARHLVDAGHNVTFITAFPSLIVHDRYREIDVSSNLHYFAEVRNETSKISYVLREKAFVFDIESLQRSAVDIAKLTIQNDDVQNLLQDPDEKFDVVVSDYIETELYAGLAAAYQCPLVWAYSLGPNWISTRLVDESTNPAYTPDYLSTNIQPFSFVERIQELWAQVKWKTIKWLTTLPLEKESYKLLFQPIAKIRNVILPEYKDIIYNGSLVLSNDHFTFGNIPNLPQNYKLVGGYHIENPVKPLPKNLQYLMNNSKNGVIYFSMGTLWKSKDLPSSLRNEILNMFGGLNQTVIWKYEEHLMNLPKNVHITKWAPQQSILAHPNCLIFITHAGLLSSTEAIHFSIPIIGIPVHYDQFVNINKAVANGYAIKVQLNYELAQNLRTAIRTMLSDARYKQKAVELSKIFHHRPVPPGKEVVHWIEHTIITRGASHLRNPALAVPWYQKTYLDLLSLTVLLLIISGLTLRKLLYKVQIKGKID